MSDPQTWLALATLTALEIVLGVDNIIFISILTGRLPAHQQARARSIGLVLAMGMRILLLISLVWIMRLTAPLWSTLETLHPLLWRQGRQFPASNAVKRTLSLVCNPDPPSTKALTECSHLSKRLSTSSCTQTKNGSRGTLQ